MMKTKFYTLIFILLFGLAGIGYGQTGIGTTTPDPSAQLDVTSTDKGILIPRMTEAERDGIDTPAEGLMIYQTNGTKGFYYFNGSTWTPVSGGGGTIIPFTSNGNINLPVTSILKPGTYSKSIGFGSFDNYRDIEFIVPRAGNLTSLSGNFRFDDEVQLDDRLSDDILNIKVELYGSEPPYNSSERIAELILLPTFSGSVPSGTICSGIITGLDVELEAGTRLWMRFYGEYEGEYSPTVVGSISGSLNIK